MPTTDEKDKKYALFAKELLGHLYNGKVEYQDRIVSAYYHPLSVFIDQFVAVKGRENVLRIFYLYYGWFVAETDLEVAHVSASADIIPIPVTHSINTQPNDQSPLVSPIDSTSTSVVMKRRGITMMVDHTLRVKKLTSFGRILRFLRLLPPPTMMSYAPQGPFSGPGLRIITKLTWVTDIHAPMHATAFNERGYVLYHENMYNPSRQSGYLIFYPFFWIFLFFCFFALVLQKFATIVSVVLQKASLFTQTHPAREARIDQAIQKLSDFWTSNVPDDFEHTLKRAFGWLLTDIVAMNFDKQSPYTGLTSHFSVRKRGDVAAAG